MPLIVIKPRINKGTAGDGGGVGPLEYVQFLLGVPHFAPYTLPKNILVKDIVVSSPNVDQNATITIQQPIAGISDLVPLTFYTTIRKETFNPNVYLAEESVVDSFDAVDELPITITFQRMP